jgi:hypothetical protein
MSLLVLAIQEDTGREHGERGHLSCGGDGGVLIKREKTEEARKDK